MLWGVLSGSHAEKLVGCADDDDDSEDPVSLENKEMRSELARHKAQLEVLKQSDPEFYEYLKTTDSELLNFGAREEDESDEDMDEVGVFQAHYITFKTCPDTLVGTWRWGPGMEHCRVI